MIAKIYTLFIFLLILVSNAFGQTGVIKGKIIDAKTGESLIGASAVIQGTTTGSVSDLDGNYEIKNVPYGEHTVEITFISYNKKIITGVRVDSLKRNVILNASLDEAGVEIKTAEVTAEANRQSTMKLMTTIKNLASVSDGISAETIKRTPDKNTGELLKRVSGTSVQNNKFVVVRGLSDRYNNALINGMPMPSFEPDRKSVAFDVFPSALIDNLIVSKTATPDMPGEFAGGLVQLNMREVPQDPFVSITLGTGMNTQSTFKNYSHYNYGNKDWLGYDDGTRKFPYGLPATKFMLGASRDQLIQYTYQFDNDFQVNNESSSPPRATFQFAAAAKLPIGKTTLGILAAATYDQQYKYSLYERKDYLIDTTTIYSYRDETYLRTVQNGTMLNLSLGINPKNKITMNNFRSVNGEQMTTLRTGWNNDLQKNIQATSDQYTSTQVTLSQLQGEHLLSFGKIKLDWGLSYSNTYRDVPNLRKMFYTRDFADDTSAWVAYIPSGSPSPNYGGRFYSELNDKTLNEKLDVTIPLSFLKGKQNMKVGGLFQQRDRNFDARVLGYSIAYTSYFDYSLLYWGQDSIFDDHNIGTEGFMINEITNGSDKYKGSNDLNAYYLMFDNTVFNNKLRIIWGFRNEIFTQKLESKDYGGKNVNVDRKEKDFLPSINLVFAVTDKMNLRFAASKTVARPEFREIAPFSFYDFTIAASVQGNDTLVGSEIYNYDLRWELYPGNNQMFSVSAFYKKFNNPIEQVFYSSGNKQYTFQNVSGATNFGMEFETRYSFSSLFEKSKFLQNFGVLANVALIKSEVDLSAVQTADVKSRPLQGQSPYIINAGIQYLDNSSGFAATLLFNRIGRRISQVGTFGFPDIYEAPRSLLDFQISKTIFKKKNGEIKLNYSDILNQAIVYYQDETGNKKYDESGDKLIQTNKPGSNLSLSLTMKF